jgi:hypothetical protein
LLVLALLPQGFGQGQSLTTPAPLLPIFLFSLSFPPSPLHAFDSLFAGYEMADVEVAAIELPGRQAYVIAQEDISSIVHPLALHEKRIRGGVE